MSRTPIRFEANFGLFLTWMSDCVGCTATLACVSGWRGGGTKSTDPAQCGVSSTVFRIKPRNSYDRRFGRKLSPEYLGPNNKTSKKWEWRSWQNVFRSFCQFLTYSSTVRMEAPKVPFIINDLHSVTVKNINFFKLQGILDLNVNKLPSIQPGIELWHSVS
jgi:hypothetical protein